jgi:hypothetical protein
LLVRPFRKSRNATVPGCVGDGASRAAMRQDSTSRCPVSIKEETMLGGKRVRRAAVLSVLALCGVLGVAPAAHAQQASGIAGLVRDTSGGALPGVTVEASSPALIEKARTVFTDGQGRFNIVDLRPGTYVVTFRLEGFSAVRREGIELPAGFTATVNADLQVGALQETITVTGAAPLVDTQNVRRQAVLSTEVLDALPTSSKAVGTLIALTPGLTGVADVGGTLGAYRAQGTPQSVEYHGRVGMKLSYDGMQVLNMVGDGNTGYIVNALLVEDMVLETGGGAAESAASGFATNAIPREGSNVFAFGLSGMYSNDKMQSDNLTDELRARGLTSLDSVDNIYDGGLTAGGPVKRDRLWFFSAVRAQGNRNYVANFYYNKTHGTPFYTPDFDRPSDRFEYYRSYAGRLTWQASPRNKVNVFADVQNNCGCRREGNVAPEAKTQLRFYPQGLYQVAWTSPVTSRFLLEAGVSATISNWPTWPQFGVTAETIPTTELSTGFAYNAAANYNKPQQSDRHAQRFSVAYVTGSHNFKAGLQVEQGFSSVGVGANVGSKTISYGMLRGVPNRVTQRATPYLYDNNIRDYGLFVQDQWGIDRLTLNFGLRYDYFYGYVPAQHIPATEFLPERSYAEVKNVPAWKDFNPRVGASYDLFGTGRTAVKVSLGRYVSKTGVTIAEDNNPITTSVNSTNRTWNDTNGNYRPDCDLKNPGANGECGPFSNQGFGQPNITSRYDPDVLEGFGAREANLDLSTEVQHELLPGMSLTAGYYKSWGSNFRASDNLAVTPEDYSPYCITAPVDARLPGGGGYEICGLYDISPAKFGLEDELVTRASHFGEQTRTTDFLSFGFNTRFPGGVRLGGGVDTGRAVSDRCFVVDSPQALLNCRVVNPFSAKTQLKINGSFPLPGDIVVSGIFQNVAGIPYQANYAAPNSLIAPSLGRNLAACGTRAVCTATATVPLIAPQTGFEDRRTQLDLRVTKFLQISQRVRLQANFDLYNALNGAALLGVNDNYGASWRNPVSSTAIGTSTLDGRLMQVSGRLSF